MKPVASARRPIVLVVDDQAAQGLLMRRAFERVGDPPEVLTVRSGRDALDLLDSVTPDLMLLDLNMPGMSGLELLEKVRTDPDHGALPTIIFSTSSRREDVDASYRLRANAYMRKPDGFLELITLLEGLCQHWFRTSILPTSTA